MCNAQDVTETCHSLSGGKTQEIAPIVALREENKRLKEENERLYKIIKMWERTCKLK